jgi:hypothetical protein
VALAASSPNSFSGSTSMGLPLIDNCRTSTHTPHHHHHHTQFQSCLVPPVIPRSMPLLNNTNNMGSRTGPGGGSFDNQLTSSTGLHLPSYEEAILQQQQQQNDAPVNTNGKFLLFLTQSSKKNYN